MRPATTARSFHVQARHANRQRSADPVFGDGSARRDCTFAKDIVDGGVACTRRTLNCDVVNLGKSQTVWLDDLIALLKRALGKPALMDRQPLQSRDVPVS